MVPMKGPAQGRPMCVWGGATRDGPVAAGRLPSPGRMGADGLAPASGEPQTGGRSATADVAPPNSMSC